MKETGWWYRQRLASFAKRLSDTQIDPEQTGFRAHGRWDARTEPPTAEGLVMRGTQ